LNIFLDIVVLLTDSYTYWISSPLFVPTNAHKLSLF